MTELAPEATPEGGEPATTEAASEPWSGPDQATWEQTQQTLAEQQQAIEYFASLTQPVSPFQQQQPEAPALDPLDENFQSQMDRYIEQKFAPYGEYLQAQQMREGEARAQDILADIKSRDGDFVFDGSTEKARTLANNYIAQTNQQYPNDPAKAAEAALEAAAKDVREWETAVGKAYHEQQLNQLAGLGGARPEQGVGTNGSQQFTIPPGGGLLDVVGRHTGGGN